VLQLLAEASVHAAATHSLKVPLLHGVQIQELPNPADPTNQSDDVIVLAEELLTVESSFPHPRWTWPRAEAVALVVEVAGDLWSNCPRS